MNLFGAINRRSIVKSLAAGAAFGVLRPRKARAAEPKGRIKQSVARGFWRRHPWEEFAAQCAELGLVGIDLVGPDGWPHLKKHGLEATMAPGAGNIIHGANQIENHENMLRDFETNIKAAAAEGWKRVITFSGSRHGLDDEEGLENCHLLLKRAVNIAGEHGVTICMELLNSKIDHPGYMCDNSRWGVELCRRVRSPHFKLLFDIYHMQIMEGDVIRAIEENIEHIGHFHTAGNPGRKDLDDDQELNYRGIMKTIARLMDEEKFDGCVAHEFGPRHGYDSLRQAIEICDV